MKQGCPTRFGWRRRRAVFGLLVSAVILMPWLDAAAQESGGESGFELTSPVRQQLRLLTESWRSWTRAYYQSDEEAAGAALEQLRSITERLGMSSLPDLSNAASAFAVAAAREGDFDRARWSLEAARSLDPIRPETHFAATTVKRLAGDYTGTVSSGLQGYVSLFRLPIERGIWIQNAGLWLLYTLIVSGGLFVALQMGTKGGALLYDLARFLSPPMALSAADVLTVAALLWPLLLPSGVLWLAIYWSVLLWGYGSLSEKLVFIVLWLSLGITPLLLSYQQREVQLTLSPPARAVDHLAAGRLYGSLFSDLGVLRTLLPEHPVTRELMADLHRRFGQWEHARSMYTAMLERTGASGPDAAAARNNLGVYHYRKKDYGTAVNYFRAATSEDPSLAEAFFNLAQAYSQLYKFSDSNMAMAQAKELDRARVNSWERAEVAVEESAVGVDGGIQRAGQLSQELRSIWFGRQESSSAADLWRRQFSLSVVAGILLLAVTLHLVRSQLGYRSALLESRSLLPAHVDPWVRALVPGLESARAERGVAAFLAILVPVALLMVTMVRALGYRAPLAFDPGSGAASIIAFGGLALLFLVRFRREQAS